MCFDACVLVPVLQVVRNVVFEPRLLPGGGATEMAVSQALSKKAQVGLIGNQWPRQDRHGAVTPRCNGSTALYPS